MVEEGLPVEREMGPGFVDVFNVEAMAGQYARVVIDKKGVDVILTIGDPTGAVLLNGRGLGTLGRVFGSFVPANTGTYQFAVKNDPSGRSTGKYSITLTELRAQIPEDTTRMEAEKLNSEALEASISPKNWSRSDYVL